MAESQPQEGPINGGGGVGASSENLESFLTSKRQRRTLPPEGQITCVGGVGASSKNLGSFLSSKRQRRPSVRLGDIGDQPASLSYESYVRRKQWKLPGDNYYRQRNPSQKDASAAGKASKTRPLTNLVNGGDCHETLEIEDKSLSGDTNLDSLAIGNRKGVGDLKAKRGGGVATKRVRSNWVSRVDERVEGDVKFSGGEDGDEEYRDFYPEGSESPLKEQSPIHSLENTTIDWRQNPDRGLGNEREGFFTGQRSIPNRARVSESRDQDGVELDGPSDTDARDWKCGMTNGISERARCRSLEDGVRMWLNGLGLGRYAPVFEIHEVDDEVLPLLTLEDLKDMGINAVGSRRKMYCAIQKLSKGFS